MRLTLNWLQRGILIAGGLLLGLSAVNVMDSFNSDRWLATLLFVLALTAFILAASSGREADAE
jgi:hypothetical protein